MRWAWIALVGLAVGCQTLPRKDAYPGEVSPAPTASQAPAVAIRGVIPDSFDYRPADRSRVQEPVVRLAAPRRSVSPIRTAAHKPTAAEPRPTQPAQTRPILPQGIRPGTIGHGDNYAWLLGRVYKQRGGWMIRYAPPGSPDRHEGIMELLFPDPMDHLKEGMLVRVEGDVLDPAPLEIQPAYRVRQWKILSR
jgi:hypothetical protein